MVSENSVHSATLGQGKLAVGSWEETGVGSHHTDHSLPPLRSKGQDQPVQGRRQLRNKSSFSARAVPTGMTTSENSLAISKELKNKPSLTSRN